MANSLERLEKTLRVLLVIDTSSSLSVHKFPSGGEHPDLSPRRSRRHERLWDLEILHSTNLSSELYCSSSRPRPHILKTLKSSQPEVAAMNTAFPNLELKPMQEYQHTQEREEERLGTRERETYQEGMLLMLTKNQQIVDEMLMSRVDFFSSASSEASSCLLLYQSKLSTS